MRSHVSSRAAAAVVCAALVLGTGGTAVATTVHETPAGIGADAARAPIADETLKQQIRTLTSLSDALAPVTELLTAVQAADNGQISAADAQKHRAAINKALDAVQKTIQAKPANPANPAKPANPANPAKPEGTAGNANPVNAVGADNQAQAQTQAAADMTAEAVVSVRKATNALLKATGTKDTNAVATQSKAVVTSLVNLAAALVMNGSLPAPNLPGMPELPKQPGAEAPAPAPELPGVPSTPKLP
ncbi:hypothetical protein ACIBLA_08100 [Streptomyces sp. NPDC050433]|uniref:hypothetical protein n=1 Tax=Streptomyces sp. NPDC050433 TaxID=3365615 RepID=UPI0037A8EE09